MELPLFDSPLLSFKASVQSDPACAADIALKNYDCEDFSEFLDALIVEPLQWQSMLVVTILSTRLALPTEFIVCFISNCLVKLRTQRGEEKAVRVFSVFLLKVLEWQPLQDTELALHLYSFSYSFCAIPEAKKVFEVIKEKLS